MALISLSLSLSWHH